MLPTWTTDPWSTMSQLRMTVVSRPECSWIGGNLETKAVGYAISNVVPEHLDEVQLSETGTPLEN